MQAAAASRSLVDWIDHIMAEYHRPLAGEIAQLDELVAGIAGRIGTAGVPRALLWHGLRDDLLAHVAKEERVLFPWIRSGRGASAGAPIQVMTQEHREAQELMATLAEDARVLAGQDDEAGRRWAAAYLAFDVRLRQHMRIEEQELFPRALVGG